MLIRTWKYKHAEEVVMQCTVATVPGHRPLVGFTPDVEEKWEKLKKKHRLKKRAPSRLCKVASMAEVIGVKKSLDENNNNIPVAKSNTASDIRQVMNKFRALEAQGLQAQKQDVYSKGFVPKKYDKGSKAYGTPIPGSLTEQRAIKASRHIAREMLQLCEVIEEYGYTSKRDGTKKITFGKLFHVYQFISDKVVGILLRARKHGMVEFEGEMLFQRRDEEVQITLLMAPEDIKYGIEHHKEIVGNSIGNF